MTRIETGALQINDDQTGLFIEANDAFKLLHLLQRACRSKGIFNNDDRCLVNWLMAYIVLDVYQGKHGREEDREVQKIECEERA